jgi:hypothetical protein
MLPAKTRKQALARHGIEGDSTFHDDPLLESLITRIVIGGREGATAITNVFNAVEQVKGSREAETVISELRATLSPAIIASIRPHLSERIRSIVG